MTPPPQPAAAVRPDTDDPDTPETNQERTPAPARTPGRGSRPGRSREGLPSSYRMRHAEHYVEQLMGDAPLQTVRQIALEHIDHPEPSEALAGSLDAADAADAALSGVADLAASIRRVGVLQPLLVVQMSGARFQLLAGGKRWLAAQAAGLTTIPCLVVHADAVRAAELRMQAAVRATFAQGGGVATGRLEARGQVSAADDVPAGTFQESEAAMTQAAPGPESHPVTPSALHGAVMADLARVEQRRASTISVARAFLADTAALEPLPIEWAELIRDIRRDVTIEARLRGVQVEWPALSDLRSTRADRHALLTGCSAILHAVLGSAAAGDRVAIAIETPRIRPAIVFSVAVSPLPSMATAGEDAASRLFAGPDGELMLEAARQSARRQGGRFTIVRRDREIILEFVVPQFFSGWQQP